MIDISKDWCINMAKLEGDAEIGAGAHSTTFCGDCHTIDGCVCPVTAKRVARARKPSEREAIVAFLRRGGEYANGAWYSWDSEMRGYAAGFAERIKRGDHRA